MSTRPRRRGKPAGSPESGSSASHRGGRHGGTRSMGTTASRGRTGVSVAFPITYTTFGREQENPCTPRYVQKDTSGRFQPGQRSHYGTGASGNRPVGRACFPGVSRRHLGSGEDARPLQGSHPQRPDSGQTEKGSPFFTVTTPRTPYHSNWYRKGIPNLEVNCGPGQRVAPGEKVHDVGAAHMDRGSNAATMTRRPAAGWDWLRGPSHIGSLA